MEQYVSNSHKSREKRNENAEKKKIEKVVTGKAKTKKKSEIRKFTDIFVSEDASNVKSYIFADVLIPALKKLISDIVTDGIDMVLYGESRHRKGSGSTRASYVSYDRYYDKKDDRRHSSVSTRSRYEYDDIILETRGEAENVLARMDELIDMYKVASIADLYDLVGLDYAYTHNKYGWTNLRNAEVVRVREGYLLKLPKALPID